MLWCFLYSHCSVVDNTSCNVQVLADCVFYFLFVSRILTLMPLLSLSSDTALCMNSAQPLRYFIDGARQLNDGAYSITLDVLVRLLVCEWENERDKFNWNVWTNTSFDKSVCMGYFQTICPNLLSVWLSQNRLNLYQLNRKLHISLPDFWRLFANHKLYFMIKIYWALKWMLLLRILKMIVIFIFIYVHCSTRNVLNRSIHNLVLCLESDFLWLVNSLNSSARSSIHSKQFQPSN